MKRMLRVVSITLLVALGCLAVTAVTNAALELRERADQRYGHRVAVEGGHLNVVEYGRGDRTIVLLGGYGTASPALDYSPLIRALDGYHVVVVEGFGYGYSDPAGPARTVENSVTELHQALRALGLRQDYLLVGHSLAGLTMLAYVEHYRDEVLGVVGIDASLPGQINGLASGRSPAEIFASVSGLLRIATTIAPGLTEPAGDDFTSAEREQIRIMTNWTFADPAIVDEAARSSANFAAVADLRYPADLPVLSFVALRGSQPGWLEMHDDQLRGLEHGRLIPLDGTHYLHWTQSDRIANEIDRFLEEEVAR